MTSLKQKSLYCISGDFFIWPLIIPKGFFFWLMPARSRFLSNIIYLSCYTDFAIFDAAYVVTSERTQFY